jgi:hypothetical protein
MLRRLDRVAYSSEGVSPVSHPAAIPRTPPLTAERRRVDDSLTCHDSPPWFTQVRQNHVRNLEVGGSSPLTPLDVFPQVGQAAAGATEP